MGTLVQNIGKLKLINTHDRNQFLLFPTSEISTDNSTEQIKMTFYFVKNTWKIKMKALPGFANNHQNPRSHKDSISKRCFCSPAPVFHELSCCGMAYKSFKEKKNALWANIRNNPRLVQCRCCYITLEQRHKIPTWNLHFNFSKLGVLRERRELFKRGRLSSVELSSKNQRN